MAVLLTRLEWFKNQGRTEATIIDEFTEIKIRISTELKNNMLSITLPNNFGRVTGTDDWKLLGSDYRVAGTDKSYFQADDKFKVYCKYDKTNSGLDLGVNSNDLIFVGDLREVKSRVDDNKAVMEISCTDRSYNLLNSLVWEFWGSNEIPKANEVGLNLRKEGWTAPLIIQDAIRKRAKTDTRGTNSNELIYDRTGNNPPKDPKSEFYIIDARLVSEGNNGFIQDDRTKILTKTGSQSNRTDFGTPDTITSLFPTFPIATYNYNFPLKSYSSAGKPVYEVLLNLSQPDMTNTSDELDPDVTPATPVIKRAMRFYLDELNRFHWFYPSDTRDTDKFLGDLNITMGTTTTYEVKNQSLDWVIFDVINFVYYEAGQDMNGNVILGFRYKQSSGTPNFKQSKRVWPKIAEGMKQEDDKSIHTEGNILPDTTKKSGYAFPASYSPAVTPRWNRGITVTSDAEYNKRFKEEARRRAVAKADSIMVQSSSQRWKGQIEFSFYNFTVGDLIQYTSTAGGQYQELLRIKEVMHTINKSGAMTTITVEADDPELKQ